MKYVLTILLFAFLGSYVLGQTFNVRLSQKHLNKVEKAKDGRSKLKRYRKFYSKDSLKLAKKERKYWKQKSDSLFKARWQKKVDREKNGFTAGFPSLDSTYTDSVQQEAIEKAKAWYQTSPGFSEAKKWTNALDEEVNLNQLRNTDSLSSYAQSYVQREAESRATEWGGLGSLGHQKGELEGLKDLPHQYKQEYGGYLDQDSLKGQAQSQAIEKAKAFLANHGDQVAAVQKKIARLQRKYISLPNSNDLSTAVKRTSLQGRTFWERLVIGGNFNINNLDPLSLDLSPQLGYRFNKRFTVGIGGTYRQTFSDSLATSPAIPANTYGFRGFSSYDVFKNFFVYGEYEQMAKEVVQADRKTTEWIDGLLIGLGRKVSVHPKLNMNLMVLYNFINEQANPIYGRRWVIRVGFQLSELALLKK